MAQEDGGHSDIAFGKSVRVGKSTVGASTQQPGSARTELTHTHFTSNYSTNQKQDDCDLAFAKFTHSDVLLSLARYCTHATASALPRFLRNPHMTASDTPGYLRSIPVGTVLLDPCDHQLELLHTYVHVAHL